VEPEPKPGAEKLKFRIAASALAPFLFTTDMKRFDRKKSCFLKKFLLMITILIIFYKSKRYFSRYIIKLSGEWAGGGAAIRICGSTETEPK
jgi:hypothetical protein